MPAVTVELPHNLAARIRKRENQLPQILERVRQVEASGQAGYVDATDIFECLAIDHVIAEKRGAVLPAIRGTIMPLPAA